MRMRWLRGRWILGFHLFQPFAQNQLDRTGFAGKFGKVKHARFLDAPGTHQKNGDRIFFRGALKNDGVQVFELPREFRKTAQGFAGLLDAAMDGGGALKIKRRTRFLAFVLVFRREG